MQFDTRAEVAERLRVSPRTVDRYIRKGLLTAVKNPGVGGHVRIPRESVDAYIKQHWVTPVTSSESPETGDDL